MSSLKNTIEKYLMLLESFEVSQDAFVDLLHTEFIQYEFPNALNKNGQTSNYDELFKRMSIGKTILI